MQKSGLLRCVTGRGLDTLSLLETRMGPEKKIFTLPIITAFSTFYYSFSFTPKVAKPGKWESINASVRSSG